MMVTQFASFREGSSRVIFSYWGGSAPLPGVRAESLEHLAKVSEVPVVLIRDDDIPLVTERRPLPSCFWYLSDTHKSDVLRIYLMLYYGGGWSDVKRTTNSWIPSFDLLESSDFEMVGYQEIAPSTVAGEADLRSAPVQWLRQSFYRISFVSLCGLGAFIFKRNSSLIQSIHEKQLARLTALQESLKKSPASSPQDRTGLLLEGSTRSTYPVSWSYLLGEVVHPAMYQYRHKIARTLPPPVLDLYKDSSEMAK